MSVQELTLKLSMGSFLGLRQDSYKRDLSRPIVETRVILNPFMSPSMNPPCPLHTPLHADIIFEVSPHLPNQKRTG